MNKKELQALAALMATLVPVNLAAIEITDELVVQVGIHGLIQHGSYSNAIDGDGASLDEETGDSGMFDLVVDYQPGEQDQFYLWARYVSGNSLNDVGGIALKPYGGDLEDDVTDINGRGRDYLMEAWYRHRFDFDTGSLALTAGLVDATGYIDDNELANNEETQFMNEAFVNSTNAAFPSYDIGAAAEFDSGAWTLRGFYMNTRNDADQAYNYFAAQLGYHAQTALGAGNYRVFAFTTDHQFAPPDGDGRKKALRGAGLSFDQELGEVVAGFTRLAWVDDQIDIPYDWSVTGGLTFSGSLWKRPQDNIGIAYGYLSTPDGTELSSVQVAEVYLRLALTEQVDISFDIQHEHDERRGEGDNPSAWVVGSRLNIVY